MAPLLFIIDEKTMKKTIAIVGALLYALLLTAQTNPLPGYIITNENDTIRGTIDYLTDIQNMSACHFRADGEQEFREYKPGEISGYRLSNNGIFYVTRTFQVGDEMQTIFAEYLLKGGVSLYYARDAHNQYYYWVDEEGKVGRMVYDGLRTDVPADENTFRKHRIMEAAQIMGKSQEAQRRLWKTNYSSKDLVSLTREYDEEYCTEAGECVQFQYDSKKKFALQFKFRVEAGLHFNTVKNKHFTREQWMETSCTSPYFGIGVDIKNPRFSNHLALEALLTIDKKSGSCDEVEFLGSAYSMSFSYYDLALQIGLSFSILPEKKVSPVIRAGYVANQMLGIKTENMERYKIGRHHQDFRTRLGSGFYVGAGADIAVGKHHLRVVANYLIHNNHDMAILTKSHAFTLGLGFCL